MPLPPVRPGLKVETLDYVLAYDTTGLVAGVNLLTPVVGSLLLRWGVSVRTVFNGTAPRLLFGVDITQGSITPTALGNANLATLDTATYLGSTFAENSMLGQLLSGAPIGVKLNNGTTADGSPGSTAGLAHLYVTVALPTEYVAGG